MQVTHDQTLLIAVGRSRRATQWQNKEYLWSEFLDKLASTTRTRETVIEYAAMSKNDRDTIKDVGGFVGGYFSATDFGGVQRLGISKRGKIIRAEFILQNNRLGVICEWAIDIEITFSEQGAAKSKALGVVVVAGDKDDRNIMFFD